MCWLYSLVYSVFMVPYIKLYQSQTLTRMILDRCSLGVYPPPPPTPLAKLSTLPYTPTSLCYTPMKQPRQKSHVPLRVFFFTFENFDCVECGHPGPWQQNYTSLVVLVTLPKSPLDLSLKKIYKTLWMPLNDNRTSTICHFTDSLCILLLKSKGLSKPLKSWTTYNPKYIYATLN